MVAVGRASRKMRVGVGIAGGLGAALAVAGVSAASGTAAPAVQSFAHLRAPAPLTIGREISQSSGLVNAPAEAQAEALTATNIQTSTNWSGLAGTSTGSAPRVRGVQGEWRVPSVKASRKVRFSSSWVGIDGVESKTLIQTGTSQDTRSPRYYAWFEMLPALSVKIGLHGRLAPVKPGDKMLAMITRVSATRWRIILEDRTRHWEFKHTFRYRTPGESAEWIEEAPTVNGEQSRIADFHSVRMSHMAIYAYGSKGLRWYLPGLTARNRIALKQHGRLVAVPGSPHTYRTGQSFVDRYR